MYKWIRTEMHQKKTEFYPGGTLIPEEVAMTFYKENSDKFIEYFPKQTILSKEMILKKVFESDFVNEEIIKYLDKNWSNLVREVGLSII